MSRLWMLLMAPFSLYISGCWLGNFTHVGQSVCLCVVGLMAFDRYQSQCWLQVQSCNQKWPDRLSASYQQQLYHPGCSDVLIYQQRTWLMEVALLAFQNHKLHFVPQYISECLKGDTLLYYKFWVILFSLTSSTKCALIVYWMSVHFSSTYLVLTFFNQNVENWKNSIN